MTKKLIIDNPNNLTLFPLAEFQLFQGDFKKSMTDRALNNLKQSLLSHRVFIAKAAFREGGRLWTTDGTQTLAALKSLRDEDGYTVCEAVYYDYQDGRMVESRRETFDEIMIPCQLIVPQGDTEQDRRQDALKKLLQINSRYAEVNPETTIFAEFEIPGIEIPAWLEEIEIPELEIDVQKEIEGIQQTVLLKKGFYLEIQCGSEQQQQQLYERFIEEGLSCRVLTL